MNWSKLNPEQRIELIKTVWHANISATGLAVAIGCSRNSICGFYGRYRDNLPDHPLQMGVHQKRLLGKLKKGTITRRSYRDNQKEQPAPSFVPQDAGTRFTVEDIPSTADDGLNVSLIDNTGCWWPLNDGGPYVFCGHARLGAYSYCERHVIRSRGVGSESERRAHRVSARHLEVG